MQSTPYDPPNSNELTTLPSARSQIVRPLSLRCLLAAVVASLSLIVSNGVLTLPNPPAAEASPAGAIAAKALCDAMAWPGTFPPRGTYTGTDEEPSTRYANSTSYVVKYQGGVCHVILDDVTLAIKHGPHPRPLGEVEC